MVLVRAGATPCFQHRALQQKVVWEWVCRGVWKCFSALAKLAKPDGCRSGQALHDDINILVQNTHHLFELMPVPRLLGWRRMTRVELFLRQPTNLQSTKTLGPLPIALRIQTVLWPLPPALG